MQDYQIRVLFVCMGNICRSPAAEAIFKNLVAQHGLEDVIHVDSAGTHASSSGNSSDPRAHKSARNKGYDISFTRSRKVNINDLDEFDYVLAMDQENLDYLLLKSNEDNQNKLELFLNYHPDREGEDVPDPYYRDQESFDHAIELIETACWELLRTLRSRHNL